MRYLDCALAWALPLTAAVFIVVIETLHPPGGILDVPFLWRIIALANFLRLRNPAAAIKGLRTSCPGHEPCGLGVGSGPVQAVRNFCWA